jgi:predicted membrane metal-binding protein
MPLTLLLTVLWLISSLIRFSFFEYLKPFSTFFHLKCIQQLPANATSIAELKALVCGESFSTLGPAYLFMATGIIHLFVVSGAHLVFLKKILSLPKSICNNLIFYSLIYAALFIFSAACEFNAPISRSFLTLILSDFLKIQKIAWPLHFKVLIAGIITLLFNPLWMNSLSLQLSWLIALAMTWSFFILHQSHPLWPQIINFVFILPTIIFFQISSPLVVLTNLFLTPFLELVLFPLSLLIWLIPRLYPVFDLLMVGLKNLLIKTEISYQIQTTERPAELILFNWGFILIMHIGLHLFYIKKNRIFST